MSLTPILDEQAKYHGRVFQTLYSNLEELEDLHACNSYSLECHSELSVAPFLCSNPYGKRTVRLDKERIDSYDCEFGLKKHALSVSRYCKSTSY